MDLFSEGDESLFFEPNNGIPVSTPPLPSKRGQEVIFPEISLTSDYFDKFLPKPPKIPDDPAELETEEKETKSDEEEGGKYDYMKGHSKLFVKSFFKSMHTPRNTLIIILRYIKAGQYNDMSSSFLSSVIFNAFTTSASEAIGEVRKSAPSMLHLFKYTMTSFLEYANFAFLSRHIFFQLADEEVGRRGRKQKRKVEAAGLPEAPFPIISKISTDKKEQTQIHFLWENKKIVVKNIEAEDLLDLYKRVTPMDSADTVLIGSLFLPFIFKKIADLQDSIPEKGLIIEYRSIRGNSLLKSSTGFKTNFNGKPMEVTRELNLLMIMYHMIIHSIQDPVNQVFSNVKLAEHIVKRDFAIDGLTYGQLVISLIQNNITNYKWLNPTHLQPAPATLQASIQKVSDKMSYQLVRIKNDQPAEEVDEDKIKEESENVGGLMASADNFFRRITGSPPAFHAVTKYDGSYPEGNIVYAHKFFQCNPDKHRPGNLTLQIVSKCYGQYIYNVCTQVSPGLFLDGCRKPSALIYKYAPEHGTNIKAYPSDQLGEMNISMKLKIDCKRSYRCCGVLCIGKMECGRRVYSLPLCGAECRLEFCERKFEVTDPCDPCARKTVSAYYLSSAMVITPSC